MIKNYFYLARLAEYLNQNITGKVITGAFTQEKDTLYLHLDGGDTYPFEHIVLCANQNMPYIQWKKDHRKAKKNVIDFFPGLVLSEITGVDIALGERDIRLKTTKGELHYILRGNKSNIYFIADNHTEVFKKSKKCDEELLNEEFENQNYSSLPLFVFEENILDDNKLRKKEYPFLSKEITRETELLTNDSLSLSEKTEQIIDSVYYGNIAVFFDDYLGKSVLCPADFKSFKIPEDTFVTDNINDAVKEYLVMTYRSEKSLVYKKELDRYFDKELGKLSSKINNLKARIDKGSQHGKYYNYGNLLLSGVYQSGKGESEITLTDFNGEEITISLDPKANVTENAEIYFDKAKSERVNFEKSNELYETTLNNYNKLISLKEKYDQTETIDELKKIFDIIFPHGNKKKMDQPENKIKYRHYIIEGNYHVYVGKDSQSNDLLTTRFAKQNDYWFHARGLPGSHVVLRVDNTKEVVPKNIIKNAASIAAFWSKAKTAKIAPVSYTFGKYVYKKKGYNPGQVALTKESVLLVKPEIPANTEMVEE